MRFFFNPVGAIFVFLAFNAWTMDKSYLEPSDESAYLEVFSAKINSLEKPKKKYAKMPGSKNTLEYHGGKILRNLKHILLPSINSGYSAPITQLIMNFSNVKLRDKQTTKFYHHLVEITGYNVDISREANTLLRELNNATTQKTLSSDRIPAGLYGAFLKFLNNLLDSIA